MRVFKKPHKLCDFYTNAKKLWLYNGMVLLWLVVGCDGLWCLAPLSTIFQLYRGDHFICGGNRSTHRKPSTCNKSLTNFITECCIVYTSP